MRPSGRKPKKAPRKPAVNNRRKLERLLKQVLAGKISLDSLREDIKPPQD
jgi:hypothetical protein